MGIGEVGELLRRFTVHIRSFSRRGQSAGSGVIWDGDGTVITNAHVMGKGSHSVELWDGRTVPAELKSRDDQRDLAKLKLPTAGVSGISLRESPVKPGELVVAVGNPLGSRERLQREWSTPLDPCPAWAAGDGCKRPSGWRLETLAAHLPMRREDWSA